MSHKTLPKISVAPRVSDEYDLKPDDLFPRNQHPDDRTVVVKAQNLAPRHFTKNNL